MRLVVVSDNHGRREVVANIRQRHSQADAFLHLGDSELPEAYLDGFVGVLGNNDYGINLPDNRIVELNGLRIFMTHGHRFLYFGKLDMLLQKAKQENCKIVLFGHTHVFFYKEVDGIHFVNPGSLAHNRDGSRPSYALIDVIDGEITVKRMER